MEVRLTRHQGTRQAIRLRQVHRRVREAEMLHGKDRLLPLSHLASALDALEKSVSVDERSGTASPAILSQLVSLEKEELKELEEREKQAETREERKMIQQIMREQVREFDEQASWVEGRASRDEVGRRMKMR